MAFPLSPTNGQTTTLNGITYVYNSTKTAWIRVPAVTSTSGTSPPSGARVGDIWYHTGTDDIYRYTTDGTSTYWLDITGPTISNPTGTSTGSTATAARALGYSLIFGG